MKLKKISFILFFQFSNNWVGRIGKTKNKKTLALHLDTLNGAGGGYTIYI